MRFGSCWQMKRLVGGDHVLDAGNRRRRGWARRRWRSAHISRGPSRRSPSRSVCAILEHRAGLDDARAGLFDIGGVDGLRAARSPCPCWRSTSASRKSPAEWSSRSPRRPRSRDGHARHDQKLLRHAAADHAGAAHPVFFGDHDPRAITGRDPRGAHAARTAADDKQIDIELSRHCPPAADRTSDVMIAHDLLAALAHLGAELAVDLISAKLCAHWFM